MPADKTRDKVEARRQVIYMLYCQGWSAREIYESSQNQETKFYRDFGPVAYSTVRDSLALMLRRNQTWYLKHKNPHTRVGEFFLMQLERELKILRDLWTLFYSFHSDKQGGLKLGALNSIGQCTNRFSKLLGVKGRTINGLALEENIDDINKKLEEYKQKQEIQKL